MTLTPEDLKARLAAVRSKRGYLLAHHGLLAISGYDLVDRYDELYTSIALTPRTMSRHDHELVWLAVLITLDESIATHHIQRFREAGGDDATIVDLLAMTAFSNSADCYQFVSEHWSFLLADIDFDAGYLRAFDRAAGSIAAPLSHVAGAAIHASTGNMSALTLTISAAYAANVDELVLAEALSIVMFPAGVPKFVRAAEAWRQLIADGGVTASPAFQTWASMSGQGGFGQPED